jgi:hypothetical protein
MPRLKPPNYIHCFVILRPQSKNLAIQNNTCFYDQILRSAQHDIYT